MNPPPRPIFETLIFGLSQCFRASFCAHRLILASQNYACRKTIKLLTLGLALESKPSQASKPSGEKIFDMTNCRKYVAHASIYHRAANGAEDRFLQHTRGKHTDSKGKHIQGPSKSSGVQRIQPKKKKSKLRSTLHGLFKAMKSYIARQDVLLTAVNELRSDVRAIGNQLGIPQFMIPDEAGSFKFPPEPELVFPGSDGDGDEIVLDSSEDLSF